MNRLTKEQRTRVVSALVEGNSIRATARMIGVAFNTVLKLVPEIGRVWRVADRLRFETVGAASFGLWFFKGCGFRVNFMQDLNEKESRTWHGRAHHDSRGGNGRGRRVTMRLECALVVPASQLNFKESEDGVRPICSFFPG